MPTEGWDFSWFAGRASEERPPWGYARQLGERMSALAGRPGAAALDLQTGGGEVLASVPAAPPVLVATECWPPNIDSRPAQPGGRCGGRWCRWPPNWMTCRSRDGQLRPGDQPASGSDPVG